MHLPAGSILQHLDQSPVNRHSTAVPIKPGTVHTASSNDMSKVVCLILEHFCVIVPVLFKLLNALQSSLTGPSNGEEVDDIEQKPIE